MIELQTLGAVAIREAEGRPLGKALTQPKRLALLAYLAIASPNGSHRRDTLVAMFWPELDESRARTALRQALRYVRQALGGEAVVSRGEEEVGLAADAVACDVAAFRRALAEGDDAGALALYGGDLLPGLHISGAAPFDQWLETERAQLRDAAKHAVLRLATAAESAANAEGAVAWLRRGLELDPVDEAMVVRLLGVLDRSGRRSAALAAYESFEKRLREEYELEPDGETVAQVAAIRDRAARAPEAPDALRISVARFENRTGNLEHDRLGVMAAEQIAQALAAVPDVQVVAEAAGTLVDGAYDRDGETLRFQVRITDAARGRLLRAPDSVRVAPESPLSGLDELQRRTAAVLAPQLDPRVVHAKHGAQPASYEAYRAYRDGLTHFVRRDWAGALVHFRRSVGLEPDYALPRIVSAIALWNLGELAEAQRAAEEAAELRASLAGFESAVLDMVQAWLRGDWAAAHEASQRQAELAPGSIPHFQVAEEARRLNRPREARTVLMRLDPASGELDGFILYWTELTYAHHMLGEHLRELECVARAKALYGDHPLVRLMEVRALAALGRVDAVERLLDAAQATPDQREPRLGTLLREAALELQAHGHADAAQPWFERSVLWYRGRPASERRSVDHRRELGRTLYLAGDADEAAAVFRELVTSGPHRLPAISYQHGHLQGHVDEGFLAACAVRAGDAEKAGRWCRWLEQLERPFLFGAQWFWLAVVAAQRGERETAVPLLRRAFADGLPFEPFLHTDPHLATLRGYAPFDELMRPRG